jgi:hypothetical protein
MRSVATITTSAETRAATLAPPLDMLTAHHSHIPEKMSSIGIK